MNAIRFIFICKEHSMAYYCVRLKMPNDELLVIFSVSF
jgi:hypothetical protein